MFQRNDIHRSDVYLCLCVTQVCTRQHVQQVAQLSQRDRAAGWVILMAKSGRL